MTSIRLRREAAVHEHGRMPRGGVIMLLAGDGRRPHRGPERHYAAYAKMGRIGGGCCASGFEC